MRLRQVICSVLLLAFAARCTENANTNDQFVFGVAYGFCAGDCAHFFRIKGGQLFTDSMERYVNDEYLFKSEPLPDEKYQQAKTLLDDFPDYLLNHANQTFGCPDCADQGGYHLLRIIDGTTYYWHIDTNTTNQPKEIQAYMAGLRDVVQSLMQ